MRRRAGGRRCGARGRGQRIPRTRAAPGLRPGPLRVPARSSLTAAGSAGRVGAEARPPDGDRRRDTERPALKPESKARSRRRKENAAVERREAPALRKRRGYGRTTAASRGAPPPLFRGTWESQATPAPRQRIRAMTLVCPSFRGARKREPGIHNPGAAAYGFRARSQGLASRNDKELFDNYIWDGANAERGAISPRPCAAPR